MGVGRDLPPMLDAAWSDCACWMDPASESPSAAATGRGMGLDPGLRTWLGAGILPRLCLG